MIRTKFHRIYFVYLTTNLINGKQYIGEHTTRKENDLYLGSGVLLHNAIKKYGRDNFKRTILEYFPDKNSAFLAQAKYILQYNTPTPLGYNLSPTGGLNVQGCHTKETCNRISNSQKGKIITNEQRQQISKTLKERYKKFGNPNVGIKRSLETIKKMSISLKGRKVWNKGKTYTEEHKLKLSIAHRGLTNTKEQNAKVSKAVKQFIKDRGQHWNVGYKHTEETKQRIAAYQKGKKKSEKMRRKLSESKKGHIVSEETRRKISETKRLRKLAA